MSRVDPLAVAAIIRDTAAAVILPRFRQLHSDEIREKHPGDYVTIADTEAEALLTRRLSDLLPESCVVGEEAVAANPAILERVACEGAVWIIDPVDGTANFARGHRKFAVIVALSVGGETLQGWIHDPLSGETALAERGRGALLHNAADGGTSPLRVAPPAPPAEMTGTMGSRRLPGLRALVRKVVHSGSAGHDYLALAKGEMHFATYGLLQPWDHAAGVLIQGEAGGYSALTDGSPYRPAVRDKRILLAPDQAGWRHLLPHVG